MKILVCGSRDFGEFRTTKGVIRDKKLVVSERNLFNLVMFSINPTYIVQGFASGADNMARLWANKNSVSHSEGKYEADWDTHGKRAGPKRNQLMLDDNKDLDLGVAFEGGVGTNGMIRIMKKAGIEVIEPKLVEIKNG